MNKLFKFLIGVTFLSLTLTACSKASSGGNSSGTTDNPSSVTHEHTYSSSWTYDSTYHWHESTCGHDVINGKAAHTFRDEVTPATYESEGYTTHTCTLCGYSYKDNYQEKLTYTITWKNYDGSVLEIDTNVAYNSTPSYDGVTPTRPDDDEYI